MLLQAIFICTTIAQSTFIHLDSKGAQKLAEAGLAYLDGQQFDIPFDYQTSFYVGKISFKGVHLQDITSEPRQLKVLFNNELNSIDFWLNLESFTVATQVKLNLFGFTVVNEDTTISVVNSKIYGKIVLGNEDGALRVSLHNNKFTKFHIGKMTILNGGNWYQKMIRSAGSSVLNTLIFGLHNYIQSQVAQLITTYGSQIPSQINLPAPLESVTVQFPLASNPLVTSTEVLIDFACGSNITESEIEQPGYAHFSVSQSCLNSILTQVYLVPQLVDVSAVAQDLSEVMDINSWTLSSIFPGFKDLKHIYDVNLQITLDPLVVPLADFKDGFAIIQLPLSLDVWLVNMDHIITERGKKSVPINDSKGEYYTQFNATASVNFGVLKQAKGFVGTLNSIGLLNIKAADESKFDVKVWNYIESVAMQFGRSYANEVIYGMMLSLEGYIQDGQLALILSEEDASVRIQF